MDFFYISGKSLESKTIKREFCKKYFNNMVQ